MGRARILVIGGEVNDAREIQLGLERMGYIVPALAHSLEDAIRLVTDTHPDLAIAETGLRGKFDGIEAARQIHLRFHIPVLYLAAHTDAKTIHRLQETGASGFLLRPFKEIELEANIELAIQRHRLEEKLQESEELFRQLAENIDDVFWLHDFEQNRMVYLSPAYQKVTGYPGEPLYQQPWSWQDVVDPADQKRVGLAFYKHITGEQQFNEEYRVIQPDGSVRWNWTRAFWIRNESGEIYRMAGITKDITDRKVIEANLLYKTLHDGLTGLPNRNLFMDRLEQAVERIKRHSEYLCVVLFLDLDGFKAINDSYGHSVGDEFLIAIARRLESCLRPTDTVARFGGDEFAILVEDVHDANEATSIADRIQRELVAPFDLGGKTVSTSASIGIALARPGVTLPDDMLRNADIAMYRAKTSGKARYDLYEGNAL